MNTRIAGVLAAICAAASPCAHAAANKSGLGFGRDAVVGQFSRYGFAFQAAKPTQHGARMIGLAPNKLSVIELSGNPKNLFQVSLAVTAPKDSASAIIANSVYTSEFINRYAPSARKWIFSSIEASGKSRRDETFSRVFGGRKVGLTVLASLGMFVVSIEPVK